MDSYVHSKAELESLFRDYPLGCQCGRSDPLVIAQITYPTVSRLWEFYLVGFDQQSGVFDCFFSTHDYRQWGFLKLDQLRLVDHPERLTMQPVLKSFNQCLAGK